MVVSELKRGDMVVAVEIPEWVCVVPPGTVGVVFEETNAYGDDGGPMVRWANGCACNVYAGMVTPWAKPAVVTPPTDLSPAWVQANGRLVGRFEDTDGDPLTLTLWDVDGTPVALYSTGHEAELFTVDPDGAELLRRAVENNETEPDPVAVLGPTQGVHVYPAADCEPAAGVVLRLGDTYFTAWDVGMDRKA